MDTYFASPERSSYEKIQNEIRIVTDNAVIDGLLKTVNGLLAVLNEQREIIKCIILMFFAFQSF